MRRKERRKQRTEKEVQKKVHTTSASSRSTLSMLWLVIVIILFIISSTIAILAFFPLSYPALMSVLGKQITPQSSTVHVEVISFFFGNGSLTLLTPNEVSHLRDVRMLLWIDLILAFASSVLLVFLFRTKRVAWDRKLQIVTGTVLVLAPILAALVPFDSLFRAMHLLLFPQGNWQFSLESLLIQTYPPEFFVACGVVMGMVLLLSGLWFLLRGCNRFIVPHADLLSVSVNTTLCVILFFLFVLVLFSGVDVHDNCAQQY